MCLKDERIAADGPPSHLLVSDWVVAAYGVDDELVPAREDWLLVDAWLTSGDGGPTTRTIS